MIVRVDLADKLSSGGRSHDSTQPASGAPDFAASPLRDLMELLHSSEAGLRTSDAAVILKTVGPNRIDTAPTRRLLIAFIERFSDPLVLILLFAAAVSALCRAIAITGMSTGFPSRKARVESATCSGSLSVR